MLRQLFGGPVLTAAVLAAALGVSYARRRDEKRRRADAAARASGGAAHVGPGSGSGRGRFFAVLSAEALKLLVRRRGRAGRRGRARPASGGKAPARAGGRQ